MTKKFPSRLVVGLNGLCWLVLVAGGDLDWRILLAQCKNNVSWFINDLYNKMAAEGGECRSQVLTAVLLQGEAD